MSKLAERTPSDMLLYEIKRINIAVFFARHCALVSRREKRMHSRRRDRNMNLEMTLGCECRENAKRRMKRVC